MTPSHICLQNTNQTSYCFSNLLWCSRSMYESLALYLLTRKHYLSFWEPVVVLVLMLNHTHDIFHIWLQNTNQASYCLSKLWWCTWSPYESLALYLLTRKLYINIILKSDKKNIWLLHFSESQFTMLWNQFTIQFNGRPRIAYLGIRYV